MSGTLLLAGAKSEAQIVLLYLVDSLRNGIVVHDSLVVSKSLELRVFHGSEAVGEIVEHIDGVGFQVVFVLEF